MRKTAVVLAVAAVAAGVGAVPNDARRAEAEKSFVLLKNNGVLPLDRAKCRRIQMWGRYKDETALLGNYNGQPGFAEGVKSAKLNF